jgi:hypothetical protein
MENIFHKLSKKLSVELVAAPMDRNLGGTVDTSHLAMRGSLALTTEALQAQEKLGKKAIYDEFDRLLGLETRTANPVLRIASAFLGPLMRIIRVFVYLVRVLFNLTTWRDPYMSFFLFICLSVLCLILAIFPWRVFFFLTTFLFLGPQVISRPGIGKHTLVSSNFIMCVVFFCRTFFFARISRTKQQKHPRSTGRKPVTKMKRTRRSREETTRLANYNWVFRAIVA